ncbi:hypothetical protein HYS49_01870 [Candidatus Woesearchaeota archaeon]|nr:hypothetical protein [Candidatus Woesearchaeota archaeon]
MSFLMPPLYFYATPEQQRLSVPYPFVEYQGNEFIRDYLQTRRQALANLRPLLNQSSAGVPAQHHLAGRAELGPGEIATSQLLDAVFGGDETLLKKLRRKAELQKVRNAYSGQNLSVCSAADADLEHYLRLARALSSHYCSTNSLQSLSTLLKVNDKIISRAEEVDNAYALVFSSVLSSELDAIRGLYGNLKERPLTQRLLPQSPLAVDKITVDKRTIEDLGMIVQDKIRARAYIQGLLQAGYKPHAAIILEDKTSVEGGLETILGEKRYFDPGKSFIETVRQENIPYKLIPAQGFNEAQVISALRQAAEEYFIFSGSGILKKDILSTGKKLIHVHPGRLPEFRGSTTFIYSFLSEAQCTATGFFMTPQIDAGDIITSRDFPPPAADVDFSRIYDPYIRSQVLADIAGALAQQGALCGERQNAGGEIYYAIHPVLRTLAIGYQKRELEAFEGL